MNNEREPWIDWMKVIGMFFIIWGHSAPNHSQPFIYSFSVPLFFCISGYLNNGGGETQIIRHLSSKLLKSIVLPYFIICMWYVLVSIYIHLRLGDLQMIKLGKSFIAILIGWHGFSDATGCGNMWFVYTLFILKILSSMLSKRKLIILSVLGIIAAVIFNNCNINLTWAVTNTLLALPFYMIGNLCKGSGLLSYIRLNSGFITKISLSIIAFIVVLFVSMYNGVPMLVECYYGKDIFAFFLVSLSGTFAIYSLSCFLNNRSGNILKSLSSGTIIILAFQMPIIRLMEKICNIYNSQLLNNDYLTFVSSILILLMFYPIIALVQKYFPILMGYRK